jgi:hypothetical protein
MPLTVVSTPALSNERATIGASSSVSSPVSLAACIAAPNPPGGEGVALHLPLQPGRHQLGIGERRLEVFIAGAERGEHHVAVRQQKMAVLARHAHGIGKDPKRIGFGKIGRGVTF